MSEDENLWTEAERISTILRDVAESFEEGSPEYQAVRRGATALLFIVTHGLTDRFDAYCRELGAPPTEEQQAFLREHGLIDPPED